MSSPTVDLCLYCQARHACPFCRLPDAERRRIRAAARKKLCLRGEHVVRQGEKAAGVHVVQSGVVRLSHVTPAGKTTMVKLLGPAGLIGVAETLTGRPYLLGAEAVETSRLEFLPRAEIVAAIGRHPEAAAALLGWLASELHRTLVASCESAGAPLTTRLWHKLRSMGETCGLATDEGVALCRHITVEDLAHGLGCTRQWVSKLLGELEHEGLIRRRGRQIILPSSRPGSRAPRPA